MALFRHKKGLVVLEDSTEQCVEDFSLYVHKKKHTIKDVEQS